VDLVWTIEMAMSSAGRVERDEALLVAASRQGDHDAFADLVRLHQRRVFKLAGRFFRKREDVEDAAQDTFLTVFRKLDSYRGSAPFEHWLTRVCLNCCYARCRRKPPQPQPLELDVAAPGHDPDAGLEIERLLRPLDPRDRFILLLLDGEGWTVAEIAERIGWSKTNVKVRAHRARKKLRKLLEAGA
jgi:RNA polymerase sigma-70 factor (ECF subfamily)